MGWVSYCITGKVDRKAECDKIFNCEHLRIEKSRMVGSTYYAAVRVIKRSIEMDGDHTLYEAIPEDEQKVFGYVILTTTRKNQWETEFAYKANSECAGPCERRCPDSILNLLTPTEDGYALKWRKDCREYNQKKKFLKNAPLGTKIELSMNDDMVIFEKKCSGRKIYWLNKRLQYIPESSIPEYKFAVV